MSLKYKVSLFVSLLFVVSGVASMAVNRALIMPSFVELERQQAQRNVERAIEALHRDLDVLSTNVTAWAWWDDSKRFMEGQNAAFVEAELSEEPVASAEVSYMGFYRANGVQVIYRAPAATEPGSTGLGLLQEGALPPDHPLLRHSDLRRRRARPRRHAERADARRVPADPTSSGEGPAAGVLIFGRLLDRGDHRARSRASTSSISRAAGRSPRARRSTSSSGTRDLLREPP